MCFPKLLKIFIHIINYIRVLGTAHAIKKILAESGYRGLWKGSIPNVQRAALVNLGDLTTYDTAKQLIMQKTGLPDSHLLHCLSRYT